MRCYAMKPLLFNEADLGNLGDVKEPKDLSFSAEDVKKGKIKNLPDCAFVRSFIKQGILVEAKDKEK